mgnify:CR=1 FL=1
MLSMLLPLLLCLVIAVLTLALVAIPARREGRDLLTPRGEEVLVRVKSGTDAAAARTSDLVTSAAARVRSTGSESETEQAPTPR